MNSIKFNNRCPPSNIGIGNKLIRLSVGIESYEDLYNDLDQAIKKSSE